jgi:hypothetical protein
MANEVVTYGPAETGKSGKIANPTMGAAMQEARICFPIQLDRRGDGSRAPVYPVATMRTSGTGIGPRRFFVVSTFSAQFKEDVQWIGDS